MTEIAGTTRDVLRETVSFGGVTLRLSDTAGMREAADTVEKIGVDRAEREIASAELILAVFDGSEPLADEDRRLLALLTPLDGAKIAVINKEDAGLRLTDEELAAIAPHEGFLVVGGNVHRLLHGRVGDLHRFQVELLDAVARGEVELAVHGCDEAEAAGIDGQDAGTLADAVEVDFHGGGFIGFTGISGLPRFS